MPSYPKSKGPYRRQPTQPAILATPRYQGLCAPTVWWPSYPHTARHKKRDKQTKGVSTAACTQTSRQLSRQLDHGISISDQPHLAHRDQLQIGRASPRALHTKDRDAAQASRQEHASTTPVTQEPINTQHYSETSEPVMGCIQDPSAGSPQSTHGPPPGSKDLTIRQQGRNATPWTSPTRRRQHGWAAQ